MTNNTIIIEKLREHFISDLEVEILNEALDNDNDFKLYLLDVTNNGCESGAVASLIYWNQTSEFHDKYEDEINELIEVAVDSSGLSFSEIASSIDVWDIGQLKNWKSWFAYETVSSYILEMYEEIEKDLNN